MLIAGDVQRESTANLAQSSISPALRPAVRIRIRDALVVRGVLARCERF